MLVIQFDHEGQQCAATYMRDADGSHYYSCTLNGFWVGDCVSEAAAAIWLFSLADACAR